MFSNKTYPAVNWTTSNTWALVVTNGSQYHLGLINTSLFVIKDILFDFRLKLTQFDNFIETKTNWLLVQYCTCMYTCTQYIYILYNKVS